jgi:hypothetical protein
VSHPVFGDIQKLTLAKGSQETDLGNLCRADLAC